MVSHIAEASGVVGLQGSRIVKFHWFGNGNGVTSFQQSSGGYAGGEYLAPEIKFKFYSNPLRGFSSRHNFANMQFFL